MAFRADSTDLYSTNAHALIRTKSILAISPYLPSVLLRTASETGGVVSCDCQLFNCERRRRRTSISASETTTWLYAFLQRHALLSP